MLGLRDLPLSRSVTGFGAAVVLPALGTWTMLGLGPARVGQSGYPTVYLLAVVITAVVGGFVPALTAALISSVALNYFFIDPVHTLRIDQPDNLISLFMFVAVAALVGAVVHVRERTARQAAHHAAQAQTLAAIAGGVLQGERALPSLLNQTRTAFGMTAVSLLQRQPSGRWSTLASDGAEPAGRPELADLAVEAGPGLTLALVGRELAPEDRRVLAAVAAQVEGLRERDRLAEQAQLAAGLEAADRLRTALLVALGHDLRTPLAAATAAVGSLGDDEIGWTATERAELLRTAETSLDRLGALINDLLDLSRLQEGVLAPTLQEVWLEDLIGPALTDLGPAADRLAIDVPDDLPAVRADPALLTRVLANLVTNAIRFSPVDAPPSLRGREEPGSSRVVVQVVDHGPGVQETQRDRLFQPFQRLDDHSQGGLGLGLALSRGLVEAMGGTVAAQDTAGGGLTMTVHLPVWGL